MITTVSTHLFLYYSLIEKPVAESISKAGFRGLELWAMKPHFPYDEEGLVTKLKKKVEKEKLSVISAHLPMYERIHEDKNLRGMLSPSSEDTANRKKWQKEAINSAIMAKQLGAIYFTVHTDLDFYSAGATELENTKESLKNVVEKFPPDCFLCVENDIGGIEQINGLLNLIEAIDKHNIGLTLDLGHLLAGAGNIEECIKTAENKLRVVHAHDNNGAKDDHLPPGNGIMEWDKVFETLEETSFEGPFVWEIRDPTLGKDENFVELGKLLKKIKAFENERKKSRKNA